jgi:hypothetical protein
VATLRRIVEAERRTHARRYHAEEFGAEQRICEHCDGPYTRNVKSGESLAQWQERRFCSRRCVSLAVAGPSYVEACRAGAAALAEDVDFLLDQGLDRVDIARRLEYAHWSFLRDRLARWGHDDLVARFDRRGGGTARSSSRPAERAA